MTNKNPEPDIQPPAPDTQPPAPTLPLMKTFEDAVAFCDRERDGFYLTAFALQCWLGGLILRARAEYAEKKDPKDRLLQRGQAWRDFQEMFPIASAQEPDYLLACLLRFSRAEQSFAGPLSSARTLLSIEQQCLAESTRRDGASPSPPPEERAGQPSVVLLTKEGERRPHPSIHPPIQKSNNPSGHFSACFSRLCDWLDAVIHLRAHTHWHLAPACFDPDVEKRELAELGHAQRHITKLNPNARAYWHSHFSEAAERFKDSSKWPTVGRAMSDESDRLWPYRDVDTLVITLWPLVKKHNWTYRDLLNVVRPALLPRRLPPSTLHPRPSTLDWSYPCDREQDLATYCTNVLGLRKTTKGVSAKDGKPKGYEVARRLWQGRR